MLAGKLDGAVDVAADAGILLEVVLDELFALALRNPQSLGKSEGTDAVDNAKVDGLGATAHFAGDLFEFDIEDACSGGAVDVEVLFEGGAEGGILADGGDDAQLDL